MGFVRYLLPTLVIFALQSFSAIAAPPVAFDGWSKNGQGLSATCPTNFGCEVNGADKDMLQRILWSPTGTRYVQTIIDSTAADKTHMTSESFINANNNNLQGISAKQVVSIPGADNLTTTAILNTGWADTADSPSVYLNQVQHSSYKGAGYASRFIYEGNLDASGSTTGYYLDIRQEVTNSTLVSSTGASASGTDLHVFVTRKAGGDRVTAGSASLPSAAGMGMMGGGPAGGSVSWRSGNEVQVIWIGQICQGCQSGGMMGGMMGGGNSFSYQSYDNLSDSTSAIASRNFSTSPINWKDPPFGATPSITPSIP